MLTFRVCNRFTGKGIGGSGEEGVALFTFGGSAAIRGTGERVWVVVHVSPADVRHFTRTPMLVIEKLAYLGHASENVLRGLNPGDSHVA